MSRRFAAMTDTTRLIVRISVSAILLLVLVVAGIAALDRSQPPVDHMVTIDGGEGSEIELWDSHETRGAVTGRARDGEAVQLLSQEGEGCEVETVAGQRGWVICADVIKEFK
jgi:hypothetical protein